MTKIEHTHFIEYLKFLGRKYPKMVLSQEKLDKLQELNDHQMSQYLQLLYQKFELNGTYEERIFQDSLKPITPEVIEVESVMLPSRHEEKPPLSTPIPITIPIEASPEPKPEPVKTEPKEPAKVETAPLPVAKPSVIVPEVNVPGAKPVVNTALTPPAKVVVNTVPPVTREPVAKPRYKYNVWRIGIAMFLLLASAYTVYKFIAYSKLAYIYVLTDELLVRTSSDKTGKVLGSMNLFGRAKGRDNKEVLTFAELKLYSNEKQGAFYKVIMSDFPFLSYLLNLDNIGYVYAKYVTTDKAEQERYQKIFKPIKDDYYELKNLEFAYRAIIVNAISTQPALMNQVLKGSCDAPSMAIRNAPLRVGHYQNKDKTVFFVLVQLSDGNYYSIEGDGFYNALPAKPIYLNDDLMREEGKFTLKGDYFLWESCDKTTAARSNRGEFDYFITE